MSILKTDITDIPQPKVPREAAEREGHGLLDQPTAASNPPVAPPPVLPRGQQAIRHPIGRSRGLKTRPWEKIAGTKEPQSRTGYPRVDTPWSPREAIFVRPFAAHDAPCRLP